MKAKVILGLVFFAIIALFYLYRDRPQPSSAQITSLNGSVCSLNDTFLCASLAALNEKDFLSRITGATVDSFDGTTRTVQTWVQDSARNYSTVTVTDGVETDRVLHQNNKHITKNSFDKTWHNRAFDTREDPENNNPIADLLGLDETLGAFLVHSPVRNNYTFKNKTVADCGGIACVRYEAFDSADVTNRKPRVLYFEQSTHRLLKFESNDPAAPTTLTFDYTPHSKIDGGDAQ